MRSGVYNYGECHVCGELMREKRINQNFWIKKKLLVIENVPAGVCPQCGEKVVNAKVGAKIARILENSTQLRSPRRMIVPVISL